MPHRRALALILIAWSLLVHVPGLLSPLLDHHAHRQCQTASMSRNFYRHGMNLFHPELDTLGPPTRAGTEFPIYSYIVALLYKLFGIHEVLGRLFSVFLTAWSALFLFRFVSRRLGETTAFWSSLVMCSIPVHIYFTRTFQPEPMALWGVLGFLDYTDRWLRTGQRRDWLLALFLGATGPLLKLPYLYLIIGLAWALGVHRQKGPMRALGGFLLLSILAFTVAWYAWAKSAPMQVLPMGLAYHVENLAPVFTFKFWLRQFVSRFPEIGATYAGVVLGVLGWQAIRNPFFKKWWAATFLYTLLCGQYGFIHQYTAIPWAPANAVLIAVGLVALWKKGQNAVALRLLAVLLVLAIPSHAALRIRHWYTVERTYLFRAREVVAQISQPQDLFFTNTDEHPVLLYYIDRYGYVGRMNSMTREQQVDALSKVRFALTPVDDLWKENSDWAAFLNRQGKLIHADTDYLIYEIR